MLFGGRSVQAGARRRREKPRLRHLSPLLLLRHGPLRSRPHREQCDRGGDFHPRFVPPERRNPREGRELVALRELAGRDFVLLLGPGGAGVPAGFVRDAADSHARFRVSFPRVHQPDDGRQRLRAAPDEGGRFLRHPRVEDVAAARELSVARGGRDDGRAALGPRRARRARLPAHPHEQAGADGGLPAGDRPSARSVQSAAARTRRGWLAGRRRGVGVRGGDGEHVRRDFQRDRPGDGQDGAVGELGLRGRGSGDRG